MKKATIFIMAVLLVAQFNSMQKINYLENDLQAARREIASVDNKIEDIYENVDRQMKEEASRIFTADTKIVGVDLENLTAEVLFTVQPKEVANNTRVYLRVDEEEFALTKDNLTYTVAKHYPITTDSLYPVVIIENDGVRYSEEYRGLRQSIRRAVMLNAAPRFSGNTMTSVNRYQENGFVTVRWTKQELNEDYEIYFTKMDYVVKVGDTEIDRIPFEVMDTSGPNELEVIKEYEVTKGQVITTYVEAEDNLGLKYTYQVHQRIVGESSPIGEPPYLEKVTVVTDDGRVVYVNDESEEW